MGAKIHYEDDLFFLHSMLKTLDSGLRLSVDPEYFRDKVLEDVLFIEGLLMRIFSSLKENTMLLQRISYLRSLRRTMIACMDTVEKLLSGEIGAGIVTESYYDKLRSVLADHQRAIRETDAMLDSATTDDVSHDVVSSEEFGYLLAGGEESATSEEQP